MIGTLNAHSLVNKTVGVLEHLRDQNIDICFLQETFLKEADTAKIQEIKDYGWSIISNPRKYRSGGGIALIYNNSLNVKSNKNLKKYKSCQIMESLLDTEDGLMRLINVYRPPYTKKARYTESYFLEEFNDFLCDLSGKPGTPIICGDFNFHLERPDDFYPKKIQSLLTQFSLSQCVPLLPTHDMGGTLDLILIPDEFKEKIVSVTIVDSGTSLSDHFLVKAEIQTKPTLLKNTESVQLSYRDFKKIVFEDFRDDVLCSKLCNWSVWCSADIDESLNLYNTVLQELMDKHCPMINKTIRGRSKPWFDDDLRKLRRKRRAAERAWRTGKGSKLAFAELKKSFDVSEFSKRCKYNREALLASAGDTKALYKKVNRLTGQSSQSLPSSKEPKKLADDFKNYFSEKINNIRSSIEEEKTDSEYNDANVNKSSSGEVGRSFGRFKQLTGDELVKHISQLSNKFCCLDPIPTFLLKKLSKELSPILLHIVNCSLDKSVFPSEIKKAVVKPTIKKTTADAECLKNYRPVSNLPVISKLIEKIVLDQLNQHLETNKLHCPVQSGYRPNHSCETLLVKMTDEILKEIHKDNIVVVILLDLSAAFDTIDYTILLNKLSREFGITGDVLDWFESYLTGRYFSVKIGQTLSDMLCMLFGVPQGSLLGPVLFILYIKQLEMIARKYGLSIQLYADDSQLYISFHPMKPSELHNVTEKINQCLAEVKEWMVQNFMKLNEDKTELLLIGKSLVLKKFDLDISFQFGKTCITPTVCKGDNWKSLGVLLDGTLSMERQINNVKRKCCWTMTSLRTIRRYLDEPVKLMLVKQLIISKVDYCNSLYYNLPKKRLKKLQSVLNGGVRYIYNITDRNEDLTPYYKKAHILPVEQRLFFKVCLLCFKIVNGVAPEYLCDLVEMARGNNVVSRTRMTSDESLMKLPKMSRLKASNRRFSNYAPEAWNSLPGYLRRIEEPAVFKGKLKNYLYDQI